MRQTSFKSHEVAELVDEIVERMGESRVGAMTNALEKRLSELRSRDAAERTLAWLEASVWPNVPEHVRGKAPTKAEQEELLGYASDGR